MATSDGHDRQTDQLRDGHGPTQIRWRSPRRLPDNWRNRLPLAGRYYAQHVAGLRKTSQGRAVGRCPFHDDQHASLSVMLGSAHSGAPLGGWKCFAGCGSGDLIAFHMRRTSLGFVDAVLDLLGGCSS